MTKRLPPKGRQPWPAFLMVTAAMIVTALVAAILLDYIGSRRGERSYLFAPAERGQGPQAVRAPAPGLAPSEKPEAGPKEKPAPKTIEEALAASLAAAGVAEDAILSLKDAKGRPQFEVEIPAALYASIEAALDKALKAESVRIVGKKRTKAAERTEVLWSLRRSPKQDASIAFLLPAEPTVVAAAGEPAAKKGPRGQVALIM